MEVLHECLEPSNFDNQFFNGTLILPKRLLLLPDGALLVQFHLRVPLGSNRAFVVSIVGGAVSWALALLLLLQASRSRGNRTALEAQLGPTLGFRTLPLIGGEGGIHCLLGTVL